MLIQLATMWSRPLLTCIGDWFGCLTSNDNYNVDIQDNKVDNFEALFRIGEGI